MSCPLTGVLNCLTLVRFISELRCKGTANIRNVQAFSKINAYSLTFIITIMFI